MTSHDVRSSMFFKNACTVFTVAFLLAVSARGPVFAQQSQGGEPYSFTHKIEAVGQPLVMPPKDVKQLIVEDAAEGGNLPPRFGYPFTNVNAGLNEAGSWVELPNGDRLWRLRIVSAGALSINLVFDEFLMAPGATFFVYSTDRSSVIGAFTEANNLPHLKFSTQPIAGGDITLELLEPSSVRGTSKLRVATVVHAYRDVLGRRDVRRNQQYFVFGDSDSSCEVNVNCSAGSGWQDQKRSVAMILLSNNSRWCSGALINNSAQNYTPYFLTAFHCIDVNNNGVLTSGEIDDAESWLTMFKYESSACSPTTDGPTINSISGTTFRAGYYPTDMALVELSSKPYHSYAPYYAGWSRSTSAATSSAGIHHPQGDVKKISIGGSATSTKWFSSSSTDTHWRFTFGTGTVENGSSGSPIFDQNKRIVGQLTGNLLFVDDYCDVPYGWYGKFSLSWAGGGTSSTSLQPWLNPGNTLTTLNGINGSPSAPTVSITSGDAELVRLEWSGSSPTPTSYKIWRCDAAYQYGSCGFNMIGTTTNTYYVDTDILMEDPGSGYYRYQVEPIRNGVSGAWSSEVATAGTDIYPKRGNGEMDLPSVLSLRSYPNPFNPSVSIELQLPEANHTKATIYNLIGSEIALLLDGDLPAGQHILRWDATKFAAGIYICRVVTGGRSTAIRLILSK